jgi:hypothetical protein
MDKKSWTRIEPTVMTPDRIEEETNYSNLRTVAFVGLTSY